MPIDQPGYLGSAPGGGWGSLRPPPAEPDIFLQRGPQLEPEELPEELTERPVEKVPFDLEEALKGGSNYPDIARYLASEVGIDYPRIREVASDIQIIDYIRESRDITPLMAGLESALKSGVKTATSLIAGTAAGTAALPTAPFTAGAGPVVAFGTAAGTTYWLTDELLETLWPTGELPAGARRAAIAGETAGEIPQYIAAPYTLVSKQLSRAPKLIQEIAKSARAHPGAFITTEGAAGVTAAAGAYGAEALAPGRAGPRFVGEAVAGGLNPVYRFGKWMPNIISAAKSARNRMTATGAERVASDLLTTVLVQYGEDIPQLIARLEADDALVKQVDDALAGATLGVPFPGTKEVPLGELRIPDPSSAAKTGSRTLTLIEQSLAAKNAQLSNNLSEAVQKQLTGARRLIDLMMATKDPQMLKQAAQLKDELMGGIIEATLDQAVSRAQRAVSKFDLTDPAQALKASEVFEKTMAESLQVNRRQETVLWDRINKNKEAEPSAILKLMDEYRDEFRDDISAGDFPRLILNRTRSLSREGLISPDEAAAAVTVDLSAAGKRLQNSVRKAQEDAQELADKFPASYESFVNQASGGRGAGIAAAELEEAQNKLSGRFLPDVDFPDLTHPRVYSEGGRYVVAPGGGEFDGTYIDYDYLLKHLQGIVTRNRATIGGRAPAASTRRIATFAEKEIESLTNQRRLLEESGDIDEALEAAQAAARQKATQDLPGATTVGEILRFRSRMLSAMRDATAGQKFWEARRYGEMAEAALEDLDIMQPPRTRAAVSGEETIDLQPEFIDALNAGDPETRDIATAIGFSRQLNDVFTRGYGGRMLRSSRTGERATPPELAGLNLFSGKIEGVSLRMEQLRNAVTMLSEEAGEEAAAGALRRLGSLQAAEQTILRKAVRDKVMDSETGRIDPDKLEDWITENELVLQEFPDLAQDVSDARTAESILKNLENANDVANTKIKNAFTFREFIGEDPSDAIRMAIGEPDKRPADPVARLRTLVRFAKNKATQRKLAEKRGETPSRIPWAEKDIKRALADSLYDSAYVYAGGTTPDKFSFAAMKNYLFGDIARNQPSPMGVLRQEGIIGDGEAVRLSTLFDVAANIEQTMKLRGADLNEALKDAPQAMVELVTKIIGSAGATGLGRFLSGGTLGGGQIIVAGTGSRVATGFFEGIAKSNLRDVMMEAAQDPKFMAELLKKGKPRVPSRFLDPKTGTINKKEFAKFLNEQRNKARRIRAYLIAAGFNWIEGGGAEGWLADQPVPADVYPRTYQPSPLEGGTTPMGPGTEATVPQPMPQPMPQPQATAPPQALAPPQVPQGQPVAQASPEGGVTPQRSQYAAIFPGDTISGLIRQREQEEQRQGIAALMQQMQGQV
jgi:hypothetical protein